MGKWLQKFGNSVEFWVFIVVCAYFGYALYFAVFGLNFSISLTSDRYVYGLISKGPFWWAILYYGSEGVAGSVAIVLRAIGAAFALYSAFLFWRKKDAAFQAIKGKVGTALLLEAGFFLALIPSVIAAFAYFSSSENLYYFDHTPGALLLFGTGVPCLAIVLVVPALLLKLRANILNVSPRQEILKWISLSGVAYLFVVFWFNYSMLWASAMVPYPRSQQQYGLSFLLEPANFASFAITVFGLFALAACALVLALPVIMKQPTGINLKRVGIVIAFFGGYFIFNTIYYYVTGGYEAHPSVWYEVIGPLHNPNLWAATFILLGLAVFALGATRETS